VPLRSTCGNLRGLIRRVTRACRRSPQRVTSYAVLPTTDQFGDTGVGDVAVPLLARVRAPEAHPGEISDGDEHAAVSPNPALQGFGQTVAKVSSRWATSCPANRFVPGNQLPN
jgi:hypothetical protein